MTSNKPQDDLTFTGWQKSLITHGYPNITKKFEVDPAYDFNLLRKYNLPTFKMIQLPVVEFLEKFDFYKSHFCEEQYLLQLIPLNPKFQKHSLIGFKKIEVAKNFIELKIPNQFGEYLLRLSEYIDNVFGGSIISKNGTVYVEMVYGIQKNLSYGKKVPVIGKLTNNSISAKYSTNDPKLRELLWRAISTIKDKDHSHSTSHEIRGIFFYTGYFEFAYIHRSEIAKLEIIFFDAKENNVYLNMVYE